jgi:hypothetical protein
MSFEHAFNTQEPAKAQAAHSLIAEAHPPVPKDLREEASKIEHMAKTVMDTNDNTQADSLAKGLYTEWMSLSKDEQKGVADWLKKDYDNTKLDTLPVPSISYTADGNINNVDFRPAKLDFGAKGHDTSVIDMFGGPTTRELPEKYRPKPVDPDASGLNGAVSR